MITVVDLNAMQVVRIEDGEVVPLPPNDANYTEEAVGTVHGATFTGGALLPAHMIERADGRRGSRGGRRIVGAAGMPPVGWLLLPAALVRQPSRNQSRPQWKRRIVVSARIFMPQRRARSQNAESSDRYHWPAPSGTSIGR